MMMLRLRQFILAVAVLDGSGPVAPGRDKAMRRGALLWSNCLRHDPLYRLEHIFSASTLLT
jgi:hypothetical protein